MKSAPGALRFALPLAQAIVASIALAACSPHAQDDLAADASVDASSTTSGAPAGARGLDRASLAIETSSPAARAVADEVARALAKEPEIAARFAPSADGLASTDAGITSPGYRSAWTDRHNHVGARLPATADAAVEAGVGVSELYRLGLTHVGARPARLALDGGRAVYREVFPSTDVTYVARPERVEWAYTLRDAKAPSTIELAVALPKHLVSTKLVKPGALDFLDEEGHSLLRMPQPLAVDAKGIKRVASLAWAQGVGAGKLTVSLDTTGLAYPIVLDPAVETVVWEARVLVPDARYYASAAYDSVRQRVVLFGGRATGIPLADTWEFDGTSWSLRATSGPTGRAEAAMTFDSARKVTVLFGGNAVTVSNDTWEWDGTAWTRACATAPCSSTLPEARVGAALAYHAPSGKSVLFGGWGISGNYLSDTWTFDGAAWTQGSAAPSGLVARQRHAMTYDGVNGVVLLFGGSDAAGVKRNDLWAFNGSKWSQLAPVGGPPPVREGTTFVFQTGTNAALLFGGNGALSYLSDAWEYDVASSKWSTTGTGPTSRGYQASAFDDSRNVAVVFGARGRARTARPGSTRGAAGRSRAA